MLQKVITGLPSDRHLGTSGALCSELEGSVRESVTMGG